jgi:hypothetical protein
MGERYKNNIHTDKNHTRRLVSSLALGEFPVPANFSMSSLRSSVSVLAVVEILRARLNLVVGVNGKGLLSSSYATLFAVAKSWI